MYLSDINILQDSVGTPYDRSLTTAQLQMYYWVGLLIVINCTWEHFDNGAVFAELTV